MPGPMDDFKNALAGATYQRSGPPAAPAATSRAPLKPTIERRKTSEVVPGIPEGASKLDAARSGLPGATPAPAAPAAPTAAPTAPGAGFADMVQQARTQLMQEAMERRSPLERLGRMAGGAIAGGGPGLEERRKQMETVDVARQQLLQQAVAGEDARVADAMTYRHNMAKLMYDRGKEANSRAVQAIERFTENDDERAMLTMEFAEYLQRRGADDDDMGTGQIENVIAQLHRRGLDEGRYRGAAEDEPGMRQVPSVDPATKQQRMAADGTPLFDYQEWDPFTGQYKTVSTGARTAGGTTINVGPGPKEMAKYVGTEAGTDAITLIRAPQKFRGQNSRLSRMKEALKAIPKGATGAIANTPLFRTVQSALATYAGIDPGNIATVQAFDKQMNSILLDEREKLKGQGTVSDFESRMLAKPLPSLADDPRATIAVIDLLMDGNERTIKKGQAFNAARAKNPMIFQDPNAFYDWNLQYDSKQPWNIDPDYQSPAAKRFVEMVGGPPAESEIPSAGDVVTRPTITHPDGRRMILSEDGLTWEPLE